MKKFSSVYRITALLLAATMLLGLVTLSFTMEIEAEPVLTSGDVNSRRWAWPENTIISSNSSIDTASLQFVRLEDNNKVIVLRLLYKNWLSQRELNWIYFRLDPALTNQVKDIEYKESWRKSHKMQHLAGIEGNPEVVTLEGTPYTGEDNNNIWRFPLDRKIDGQDGPFPAVPSGLDYYEAEFRINLNGPLASEDVKSYAIELRLMGTEGNHYSVSGRTTDSRIVLDPNNLPRQTSHGNWLRGATIDGIYESQATYEQTPYNGPVTMVEQGEGEGLVRFRYKYFPQYAYNLASGAKKQYRLRLRLPKSIFDVMLGDKLYIQTRSNNTRFFRGTSINVADMQPVGDDIYEVIVSEDLGNATNTRDYLQPETGRQARGITDIVIPVNEHKLYTSDESVTALLAEVQVVDADNIELTNSKAQGFIVLEQSESPQIENIDRINAAKTGDETVNQMNVARTTQKSLRGEAEAAGAREIPDPDNDKKTMIEMVPSVITIRDNNGQSLGNETGRYKANNDGTFEIEFDKTFAEMGYLPGDKIQIQVYSTAAGKTISKPTTVTLIEVATNTPEGEKGYKLTSDQSQVFGRVERHQFATDFSARLELYGNVDGTGEPLVTTGDNPVTGYDISVTPDGVLSFNIPASIKSQMEGEMLLRVFLTEDTYLESEPWDIVIDPSDEDKTPAPVINGPVFNTHTVITGTGEAGAVLTLTVPGHDPIKLTVPSSGAWSTEVTLDLSDHVNEQIQAVQKVKGKSTSDQAIATIQQDPYELKNIYGYYFVELEPGVYAPTNPTWENQPESIPQETHFKVLVPFEESLITSASKGQIEDNESEGGLKDVSVVPENNLFVFNAEKSTLPKQMDFTGADEEPTSSSELGKQGYAIYYDANLSTTFPIQVNVYLGEGDDYTTYEKDSTLSYTKDIPAAFKHEIQAETLQLNPPQYYTYKAAGPEGENPSSETEKTWEYSAVLSDLMTPQVFNIYYKKNDTPKPVIQDEIYEDTKEIKVGQLLVTTVEDVKVFPELKLYV